MANSAPHLAINGTGIQRDKDWVKTSFMLPHVPSTPTVGMLTDDDRQWLYFTTAQFKFTNTGLGGNFTVNPPPKYTRYADIPTGTWVNGVVSKGLDGQLSAPARDRMWPGGMGRFYSESIDDNSFNLHMRFGMPEYKGVVTFFTGFYDVDASRLAREGRGPGLAYLTAKLIGTVMALPYLPLILAYKGAMIFLNRPSTKYYTSKPTMPLYWSRVNMIALHIAMSKGIIPKGTVYKAKGTKSIYEEAGVEFPGLTEDMMKDEYAILHERFPKWFNGSGKKGLFTGGGSLDVQAIIGTPHRVARETQLRLQQVAMSATTPEEVRKKIHDNLTTYGYDKSIRSMPIDRYLKDYFDSRLGSLAYAKPDPMTDQIKTVIADRLANNPSGVMSDGTGGLDASSTGNQTTGAVANSGQATGTNMAVSTAAEAGGGTTSTDTGAYDAGQNAKNYASYDGLIFPVLESIVDAATGEESITRSHPNTDSPDLMNYVVNTASQSNQWLTLRVDHPGTVSESFSNSTTQSEIQSKINSAASGMQAARFSLSDFNTGFAVVDTVVDTVRQTISGLASGLSLDGLIQLTGTGFVDIPERWDSASADFPTASYTMQLRAPYGHPLSHFINIDVPLACILAAVLPISHGNQSYGQPFLVELYVPGKNVIRLGMITSVSITRGTGNMGWAVDNSPLGVDVSFTIKDLSTIMHAPIDAGLTSSLKLWKGVLPQDNAFQDYLAILGNMTVEEMTTDTSRLLLNWGVKKAMLKTAFSKSSIAANVMSTTPGRWVMRATQEMGMVNAGIK